MSSAATMSMRRSAKTRFRGFTLIELMVVLSIMAVLLAIGLPGIFSWLNNARVNAVPDFYIDGLRRAREGAIKYNSAARVVLTPNPNGQYDWQIDWCSPLSTTPCSDVSGTWSTTASPVSTVAGQPRGPSIFRSASGLPPATLIPVTTYKSKTEVYFNSLGWLNSSVKNMNWILFTPADTQIPPVEIAITLAGIAERCNPLVDATKDSRGCPP